jgi:hypothetical protein
LCSPSIKLRQAASTGQENVGEENRAQKIGFIFLSHIFLSGLL